MPLDPQQAMQLALEHHRAGRLAEAEGMYRQVLLLRPDLAEAHHHLGDVLIDRRRADEAIAAYRQAIVLEPNAFMAHFNLGNALQDQGRLEEAIAAFGRAIAIDPDFAEAYYNLGNALRDRGQIDEAIAAYRQAIAFKANLVEAQNNLGNALSSKAQLDEAIDAYRQAIVFRPRYADAYVNLGNALKEKGNLDGAMTAYRQAIALKPDSLAAHNNLGNALKESGQLDEAIATFRRAITLKNYFPEAHHILLLTLHLHPDYDAQAIAEEHRRWNRQHAEPLKQFMRPHSNDRSPRRRLRIGYISPDFRRHPVGLAMLPVFTAHDHEQFQIFCYSNAAKEDEITRSIRQKADEWHSICPMSDERAAELIRQHRIDILVDLALHSAHNRLLVFARKPAPVQVTHLGYPSTTGLNTMDYRLSDPYLDPPGGDESCYTEKTVRLAHSYLCFSPPEPSPAVASLPAQSAGRIVFGCMNNFAKVNPAVLEIWAKVLRRVVNSRLILRCPQGESRRRVQDQISRAEIDPQRIDFVGAVTFEEYLHRYDCLDIGLDPFPYSGHTTNCDSLWMGVPMVTLSGKTAVSRGGVSLLRNIGLPELIAGNQEQYVDIAVGLANDLPRLAEIRRTLRDRMRSSPLMDAVGHTRAIESAYRQMWRDWCNGKSST